MLLLGYVVTLILKDNRNMFYQFVNIRVFPVTTNKREIAD